MSVLAELKRRKVFQVAIVYAVAAWAIVEIVATIEEPLGLPGWADTLVIVLVAAGFPLAIILSWVFDMTPGGIVRTSETREPETASEQDARDSAESSGDVLPNSVAVLPFENLSPNPDDAYFAAGIHEELLNQLAKISDIRVIARTSVMQYEGARRPVSEIADELRVVTVMEGSVRYAGDRVRVTAQLIDGATQDHLWSEVYERELSDIFAIQADIARRISAALEAEFSSSEQERIERPLTDSTEAYSEYLQVMALARQGGLEQTNASPRLRADILEHLNRAIALDPQFALAYVLRARVNVFSLFFHVGTDETFATRREELERAATHDLDTALAIDPDLGLAYSTRAWMHQLNWRAKKAQEADERARQLRPNDPEILIDSAIFIYSAGKTEGADELARRAFEIDPGNCRTQELMSTMNNLVHDDLDAAVSYLRKAIDLAPTVAIYHTNLAIYECLRGEIDTAIAEAGVAERKLQENANMAHRAIGAYAYGRAGSRADAVRMFRQIQDVAKTRRVPPAAWVYGYLAIGDNEQALHWLNVLAENQEPYESFFGVVLTAQNWYRDPVLERPEFTAARKRIGFQS